MRITSRALALIAALVVAVAAYIGWVAVADISDSRYMTLVCGTTMSDYGIFQVCCSLVVAGALALAGLGLFVKAWKCRSSAVKSETKSAT